MIKTQTRGFAINRSQDGLGWASSISSKITIEQAMSTAAPRASCVKSTTTARRNDPPLRSGAGRWWFSSASCGLPVFLQGEKGYLLEAPAGLLRGKPRKSPFARGDGGNRATASRRLCISSMALYEPRLHLRAPRASSSVSSIYRRSGAGGGLAHEGEDIEVLEISFDESRRGDRHRRDLRRENHHASAVGYAQPCLSGQ